MDSGNDAMMKTLRKLCRRIDAEDPDAELRVVAAFTALMIFSVAALFVVAALTGAFSGGLTG